jgi:peptidoglycan/LPS O-acetylase OafA/YrhL
VILLVTFFFFSKPWAFVGLSAVFLSNFSVLFGVPMLMGPLWSLSVEEHFYLIWPWVIRFLSVRNLILVCVGVVIAEPIFRMTAAYCRFFSPYFSWFRVDGLAFGALIAGLARTSFSKRFGKLGMIFIPVSLIMFGLSLLIEGTRISQVGTTMLYSEVSLLVAGLIAFIHARPGHQGTAFLRSGTLRFIGNISYCMYLIHLFIIMRFYQVCFTLWGERLPDVFAGREVVWYLVHTTTVVSLSCVIGHLSMRFFEGPIRSYRVRFQ